MPEGNSTTPSAVDRFWDRFIANLEKQGVTGDFLRWHVIRAEHYIKAFPDLRLAQHGVEEINGYLKMLGRNDRLKDWHFRQAVDAIQNLFATAGISSVAGVDWSYWRDSAKSLPLNHATIAREMPSVQPVEERVAGRQFKEKRNARSLLDDIRRDHRSLIEKLGSEIHRRRYSIRTEQAYEA